MTFLLFKVKSTFLEEVRNKLKGMDAPRHFRIEVYVTEKPRVSEVAVNVVRPGLPVNLNMTWSTWFRLNEELKRVEKKLSARVVNLMKRYDARMRNWNVKNRDDGELWIKLKATA